jgi:hypothetical protein
MRNRNNNVQPHAGTQGIISFVVILKKTQDAQPAGANIPRLESSDERKDLLLWTSWLLVCCATTSDDCTTSSRDVLLHVACNGTTMHSNHSFASVRNHQKTQF